MAATYSLQDQYDAVAAASAAADGTKVATFLALWQTRLGTNPALALYREGAKVWSARITGLLPIVGNAFVVPTSVSQQAIAAADIDTGTWEFRIENAGNSSVYYGATVTKAGGTDVLALTNDLEADNSVTVGSIIFNAPALDSVTETISKNDARVWMWVDPNVPFAQQITPPNGSEVYNQLTDAYKGTLFTSLPEPGVIGSGSEYIIARLTDPDDGTKKSLFHQNRSTFPTWDGTYRSAYNSAAELLDGQVYWCCHEFKVSASMLAVSTAVAMFDVHHNNWTSTSEYGRPTYFGRAPIQIMLLTNDTYRIDVFGSYTVGSVASQVKNEVVHTSGTLVEGDIHQLVFRARWGRSFAAQPFLQVWRRINGGATTLIVDRSDLEISYYDVPADTHYFKPGAYQWVSSPSTVSYYTKGFQAFREASGTPALSADVLFNLMDSL